jgi:hypothetical protein
MRHGPTGVALLALLGACLAAGPAAHATISHDTNWDVDLTGKETTSWTFSGTMPATCANGSGSPSYDASGKGSESLSVTTTKKRRIWAETYRLGKKIKFMSFATDGWQLPATATKTGSAAVQNGPPCDEDPDDPQPIPWLADATGCSTTKGTSDPTLTWAGSKLTVDLRLGPRAPVGWLVRCPDVGEPKFFLTEDTSCTPKGLGRLPLSASKFTAGKRFTVSDTHRYVCPIPITNVNWRSGGATLSIEVDTSYEVTFTPRKR